MIGDSLTAGSASSARNAALIGWALAHHSDGGPRPEVSPEIITVHQALEAAARAFRSALRRLPGSCPPGPHKGAGFFDSTSLYWPKTPSPGRETTCSVLPCGWSRKFPCTAPSNAAKRGGKARMFEHRDVRVRAGPRLASSAGHGACAASDAQDPVALSLGYFSLGTQREVTRAARRAVRNALDLAVAVAVAVAVAGKRNTTKKKWGDLRPGPTLQRPRDLSCSCQSPITNHQSLASIQSPITASP